jgi:hypothetical protein
VCDFLFLFFAGREGLAMLNNEHVFVSSLIVRVRVRIVVLMFVRRVGVTEVNQAAFWQRQGLFVGLGPRVDPVEELCERDGAVVGGGRVLLV